MGRGANDTLRDEGVEQSVVARVRVDDDDDDDDDVVVVAEPEARVESEMRELSSLDAVLDRALRDTFNDWVLVACCNCGDANGDGGNDGEGETESSSEVGDDIATAGVTSKKGIGGSVLLRKMLWGRERDFEPEG